MNPFRVSVIYPLYFIIAYRDVFIMILITQHKRVRIFGTFRAFRITAIRSSLYINTTKAFSLTLSLFFIWT